MNQNPNDNRPGAVGAALYYGITALVVVGIAVAVIAGKFLFRRKAQREIRARIDLERQDAVRRGEAGGLPTYNEYRNTIPLNVPTLAYPDAARRSDGTTAAGASSQDPSLPSYDASAPPKYEYATTAQAAVGAAGGALQRAASSIRQALSRPASIRRSDSSATVQQLSQRANNADPEMQEMTSTDSAPRVMTAAPAMHLSSQSRTHSMASLASNTMSRANSMRAAQSSNMTEDVSQPSETPLSTGERMEHIPLDDNSGSTPRRS